MWQRRLHELRIRCHVSGWRDASVRASSGSGYPRNESIRSLGVLGVMPPHEATPQPRSLVSVVPPDGVPPRAILYWTTMAASPFPRSVPHGAASNAPLYGTAARVAVLQATPWSCSRSPAASLGALGVGTLGGTSVKAMPAHGDPVILACLLFWAAARAMLPHGAAMKATAQKLGCPSFQVLQ